MPHGYQNPSQPQFVPHRQIKKILGLSDTVRRWARNGKLEFITSPAGHRLYNVSSILPKEEEVPRQKICYCRVSTKKQAPDLNNQVEYCRKQFPGHEIITDIGSALNWNRKGLRSLLDQVFEGSIEEVVVTHRDRLSRFAFELLQYFFDKHQVKLVVLDQDIQSDSEELADDIISIITVFSARYYGHRKYRKSHQNPKDQTSPES